MLVRLPEGLSLLNLEEFLSALVDDESEDMTLSAPNGIAYVHPLVICMIAAMCDRCSVVGGVVNIEAGLEDAAQLQKLALFSQIKAELEKSGGRDLTGRVIPLTKIVTNKELGSFVTDFVPLLHATPEVAESIKYVLYELIRNVLEHSGSRFGAYAAAEVSESGTILIGVADSGIGVRKTIQRSHAAADDAQAIGLAFQPGVSGTTRHFGGNETNGGAGLFFMKAMATLARQQMVLVTGNSMMRLEVQSGSSPEVHAALSDDAVTWWESDLAFVGTAVGVNLAMEDSVGFKRLLSEIRDIYRLNVSASRKSARRAKFS